ncbi:putative transposase, partial [Wolbachia endosymbiont of Drosophila ananassae]
TIIERAVIGIATEFPAYGQKELQMTEKRGIIILREE